MPDVPAERMVMRARRCQLLPVEALVCVQIVVEPSLRVKVRSGPLGPGSELEPKASMVMTLPAASAPAGRAHPESKSVCKPFVDQTVRRDMFTCNGPVASQLVYVYVVGGERRLVMLIVLFVSGTEIRNGARYVMSGKDTV